MFHHAARRSTLAGNAAGAAAMAFEAMAFSKHQSFSVFFEKTRLHIRFNSDRSAFALAMIDLLWLKVLTIKEKQFQTEKNNFHSLCNISSEWYKEQKLPDDFKAGDADKTF
jgi:hypothetical protein